MPQMTKGGKFIFGWSVVREGALIFPSQVVEEYGLAKEERLILTTGSKATGGFNVSRKDLLVGSALSGLFFAHPDLATFATGEGILVRYKGRGYCWVRFHGGSRIILDSDTMSAFGLNEGDRLLLIRGSNVAFVCGHNGPIIEKARNHGDIPVFE
jgi:hypothetical protein